MPQFSSFRDVIQLWDRLSDFAADIGVPYQTAAGMLRRDSIASGHWPVVVRKAAGRGYRGVTLELLTALERERELQRRDRRAGSAHAPQGSAA